MEQQVNKGHQKPQAGPSAKKKEKKKNKHENQFNPKAFGYNSAVSAARHARRKLDLDTKKHHIPLPDRAPVEPPPVVVAVVGPPKVGKTMLIKSLIKRFTKQNVAEVKGPITVVSGKKRRLTFIECGSELNTMIDVSKVADLVLLMVDASFGFEMETFEFLNIAQVHGFPRVMGVLTHLDLFKNNKQLRTTKKRLKHRFWTEIYQGAKLFYLSGLINNKYPKNEVLNLSRFISVMKFRPMTWRGAHPYVLADRFEDLTDPEEKRRNPKCDRTISLYGYCRGTHLKSHFKVHVTGCGDFYMKAVSFMADPCPLPDKQKKRTLNERERLLYAPMADIGDIVYDKDAVYIDMGNFHRKQVEDQPADESGDLEGVQMVDRLMGTEKAIDTKTDESELRLFAGAAPIQSREVTEVFESGNGDSEEENGSEEESEDEEMEMPQPRKEENTEGRVKMPGEKIVTQADGRVRRRAVFDDGEDDVMEDDMSEGDESEGEEEDEEEGMGRIGRAVMGLMGEEEGEEMAFEESDSEMGEVSGGDEVEEDDDSEEEEDEEEGEDEEEEEDEEDRRVKRRKVETVKGGVNGKKQSKQVEEEEDEDDNEDDDNEDDGSEDDVMEEEEEGEEEERKVKRRKVEGGSGGGDGSRQAKEEGEEEEGAGGVEEIESSARWKLSIGEAARRSFESRRAQNIMALVYGNEGRDSTDMDGEDAEEEGGEDTFFQVRRKKKSQADSGRNEFDCSRYAVQPTDLLDWCQSEVLESIRNKFVTGDWNEEDAALQLKDGEGRGSDDEELYGDFEDLETGKKFGGKEEGDKEGGVDEDEERTETEREQSRAEIKAAKAAALEDQRALKKAQFDKEYDHKDNTEYYDDIKQTLADQAKINRSEFENESEEARAMYEGYRPGLYVRIEIEKVPCEFVENFDPRYPIIIGGLLPNEENLGFIHTRVKKHRWYKRILKNNDPLVISMGWRRFQTVMQYSIMDHNKRHRLLKYTPHHMHCNALFWGPLTPPNTGFLGVQRLTRTTPGFRIALTGVVLELDHSFTVVKKLKLTGTPAKIFKNTAFIKDMFHSDLEVSKFIGASIRTVSGIRGSIKKALTKPPGVFRATFEDKILISDIVFLRAWYPVKPIKLYNPVTTLLQKDKEDWEGMKTTGQLRRERSIPVPTSKDSEYKPIERPERHFNPLKVPKALQAALPFASKPKLVKKKGKTDGYLKKRAVVMEPQEKKLFTLLQQLNTVRNEKVDKKKKKKAEQRSKFLAKKANEDDKRAQREREEKKKFFKAKTQQEKSAAAKSSRARGKRSRDGDDD